jgi:uncharacterized membrane protein YphA (DoxX/SURF4 family)
MPDMPRDRAILAPLPAAAVVLRLFVAAVLVVDSYRGWKQSVFVGSSVVDALPIAIPALRQVLYAIQVALAAGLAAGVLTRPVAAVLIAQWSIQLTAAWARVGTLGTAKALDHTLVALGVVSVCVLLLLHGPGPVAVDAVLARRRRRGP